MIEHIRHLQCLLPTKVQQNVVRQQDDIHLMSLEIEPAEEINGYENKVACVQSEPTIAAEEPTPVARMKNKRKLRMISILKNGFKSKLLKNWILTQNTCSFDSVVYIYACLYNDYKHVNRVINTNRSTSTMAGFIQMIAVGRTLTPKIYKLRNTILVKLIDIREQQKGRTVVVDCGISIHELFSNICLHNKQFASLVSKNECVNCKLKWTATHPYVPLNVEMVNLRELNAEIKDSTVTEKCKRCDHIIAGTIEHNSVLVIKPSHLSYRYTIKVDEITSSIVVNNQTYELCGVIEYDFQEKHYICHARRKDALWQTYDNLKEKVMTLNNAKDISVSLLFYVNSSGTTNIGEFGLLEDDQTEFTTYFLFVAAHFGQRAISEISASHNNSHLHPDELVVDHEETAIIVDPEIMKSIKKCYGKFHC